MTMTNTNNAMHEATNICWECRAICNETLYNYCLKTGGEHVVEAHIKLMTDCIQICQTSADFMTRNSELHTAICNACADVCDSCAESCEKMEGEEMKRCAEACRRCAQSCRSMSKMKKAA